jgi:lipoprotein-releasing system permease protein
MKQRMMVNVAHILIEPSEYVFEGTPAGYIPTRALFSLDQDQDVRFKQPGILRAIPIVQTEAIVQFESKAAGVMLKGMREVDWVFKQGRAHQLHQMDPSVMASLNTGFGKPDSVLVGQQLGFEFGLLEGDELAFFSPSETTGPMDLIPISRKAKVAGFFRHSNLTEELHTMITSPLFIFNFLHQNQVLSSVEVIVEDFERAPEIAQQLRQQFPHLKVSDWQQLNAHLFASLRLERISMFLVLAFIIVVASFNIVTTLTLMVVQKKRDISILRTMGAKRIDIGRIFLFDGIMIGLTGIGAGVSLSFLACLALKKTELIKLPMIYYDRTLPVTFNATYYLLVSVVAGVIVLVACWYPTVRAQKQPILEGFR